MNWYKKIKISFETDNNEMDEWHDLIEMYEHELNSFTDAATKMLPKGTTNIKTLEQGRCARGKSTCPYCETPCEVSACSDVGEVLWWCPKCGLVDY